MKLLGNLAFNPISALTQAGMAEIAQDPDAERTRPRDDGGGVLRRDGASASRSPSASTSGWRARRRVGDHKTSMLQDVELARPIEIGGLVGVVLELGRLVGVPMPCTTAVYACAKLLGAKTLEAAGRSG